nr:putative zinc finger, CCHC-type [Tanacetum cinerariifolium]
MTNEETVKDMTTKFDKLVKFEGQNFRRWQKKMHFLLTTLKVVYVLSTPSPEWHEDETFETTRKRMKWENDDYICRGHILNGMDDSLFDIYQNIESAKALWVSLESKYMAEDASSKKFLVGNFINYKMVDTRPVIDQYHEMLRILGQYTQHNLMMDEAISVAIIIDKLPPSWKDFKHSLKHKKPGHMKKDCRSHKSNDGTGSKGSNDPEKQQSYNSDFMQNFYNVLHYVSVISDAFYVQDDGVAGWVDSGATCHVCKDLRWFYVIEPNDYVSVNSIIESRDAIFDEERFTSIPRPRGIRMQMDTKKEDENG